MTKRYEELQKQLSEHNLAYHAAEPTLTDAEYDKLYKEALAIEAKHPKLKTPQSASSWVGVAPKFDAKKHLHLTPMLSISNADERADLDRFYKRTGGASMHCELKLDGLSLALIYCNGLLDTALTRGDGNVGEVVTANAMTIDSIPKKVPEFRRYARVEVRGEVVIHREDAKGGSARNMAAGAMRLKDPAECAERPLQFYAFQIIETEEFQLMSRQSDAIHFLRGIGFQTTHQHNAVCEDIELVVRFHKALVDEYLLLPYDADGIVVKVNKLATHADLGATRKAPRWCVAFKFPQPEVLTTLLAVTWQVAKSGTVSPVAELEPVEVDGVTIRRASLHNIGHIEREGFRLNDVVKVWRAGGVIPKIARVRKGKPSKEIAIPSHCPECDTYLEASATGTRLFCPVPCGKTTKK